MGKVASNVTLSSIGLFLYAFVGFGAAALFALGFRKWSGLALAAPLGLSATLIVGTILATIHIWSAGVAVFWVLASVTAAVHVKVLVDERRSAHVPVLGNSSAASHGHVVDLEVLAGGEPSNRISTTELTGAALGLVGFVLCLVSALSIQHLVPGWGGLLGVISPAWYVGLVLIVCAIIVGQQLRPIFSGLAVLSLQLVLTGTPAIVYDEPRYAWTAKQVGVASYIMLHGSTDPKIDIYQAWPGLFSGVAWLCKVAGLSSPLGIARWWTVAIDLATLLVMYLLALRVLKDQRRAWLASSIFVVGYAIADSDYFSSQSVGYLLGIAIFAVLFCHRDDESTMTTSDWYVFVTMAVAVAVTHQLSPYMITAALVVLVVFGYSRSRWAPLVTFAPAAAWAYANLSYVQQHVSLKGFLSIFNNVTTPGVASGGPAPGELATMVKYFQAGSVLLIGVIALVAIALGRTRLHIFLAIAASSGAILIVANSYGNEADFRVVLFALPWLAILVGGIRFAAKSVSIIAWSLILFALLPMYLVADMGLDFVNAGRVGDFLAIEHYELTAPVGSYLVAIGSSTNTPVHLTGRYDVVNEITYSKVLGINSAGAKSASRSFQQFMGNFFNLISGAPQPIIGPAPKFYVLTGSQEAASLATENVATLRQYKRFEAQFAKSPLWKLVLRTSTARLYQLRTTPKSSGSDD